MKTNNIQKFLNKLLNDSGINNYPYEAPDSKSFPYTEWEFREISNAGNISSYALEFNGYGTANAPLEDMFDIIENLLHYRTHFDENGSFTFYKEGVRQNIPESNKTIKHKRMIFEMQYAERSNL